MRKPKKQPKRLIRLVERTVANYIWKHPVLWGQSKDDVFNKALTAVWRANAKTPEEALRAVYDSLGKSRDESKHSRSCLEPFQVRKAEAKANEGGRGKSADAARQAAYREFLEDYALVSQRSAFRDSDCLRVRAAIAALKPADQEIARRFLQLLSIKAVALSFGIAPRTYLRREWADFKERFIAVWEAVDEEKLAQSCSSIPYVFAGRCASVRHGE